MSESKGIESRTPDGKVIGEMTCEREEAQGIHDIGIGEKLGPKGEPGLPEDKNEPVDLLNDAYEEICIKSAREARRQADNKCLEAICRICDAMTMVCARMEELQPFSNDEELASLGEEMAEMGNSLAKIRTSMESAPVYMGYAV